MSASAMSRKRAQAISSSQLSSYSTYIPARQNSGRLVRDFQDPLHETTPCSPVHRTAPDLTFFFFFVFVNLLHCTHSMHVPLSFDNPELHCTRKRVPPDEHSTSLKKCAMHSALVYWYNNKKFSVLLPKIPSALAHYYSGSRYTRIKAH